MKLQAIIAATLCGAVLSGCSPTPSVSTISRDIQFVEQIYEIQSDTVTEKCYWIFCFQQRGEPTRYKVVTAAATNEVVDVQTNINGTWYSLIAVPTIKKESGFTSYASRR